MKPRHKRFIFIGLGLLALAGASMLILNAFQKNLVFFYTPTAVANGEAPKGQGFRIGGMVEDGSLTREGDGLTVHFVMTDTAKRVPVTYKGILPDLFRILQHFQKKSFQLSDILLHIKEELIKYLSFIGKFLRIAV